jgi:hypothetical protein
MPTRESEGFGGAAKRVADHARSLVGLELELAKLELQRKLGAMGVGLGLGIGAAVLALCGLGFLLATLALVLAIVLDAWLAALIMTLVLFAIAGVLGMLAVRAFRRGTPPVPEQAIKEAKLTTAALGGGNGQR